MVNVTKITIRTSNEIDATPALNRKKIFRKREFNFVNTFKGDFQNKSWKDIKDFEWDGEIKRLNDRTEPMLVGQTEPLVFLNLFMPLSMIERL